MHNYNGFELQIFQLWFNKLHKNMTFTIQEVQPFIRGSKVFGQTIITVNITAVFITLMKILCSQWLPEVWSPWTSADSEFPTWRCFARPSLQPPSVAALSCLFVCFRCVFTNWKAALVWWGQVTDLVIERYSILLSSKGLLVHSMFSGINHLHREALPCHLFSIWLSRP